MTYETLNCVIQIVSYSSSKHQHLGKFSSHLHLASHHDIHFLRAGPCAWVGRGEKEIAGTQKTVGPKTIYGSLLEIHNFEVPALMAQEHLYDVLGLKNGLHCWSQP